MTHKDKSSHAPLPDIYLPAANPDASFWAAIPRTVSRVLHFGRSRRQ